MPRKAVLRLSLGPRRDADDGIRPTQERVREALLSRWQGRLGGASLLDLFAGSGIVALDAASRGATRVFFIEGDGHVARALVATCARFEITADHVLRRPLTSALSRLPMGWPMAFDLIFADPPYEYDGYDELLRLATACLAEDGELAVEHSTRTGLSAQGPGFELQDSRTYGESGLSFYRRAANLREPATARTTDRTEPV